MSFDRLLELAQEQEKSCALRLAEATQATLRQQQQMTMLQQYRLDYLGQLGQRGQQGLGASAFSQLQHFLSRLDGLIVQQQYKISQHQQAEAERRQQWLDAHQRREALAWLVAQQAEKLRKARERREQRESDEWVTQQWARRSSSSW